MSTEAIQHFLETANEAKKASSIRIMNHLVSDWCICRTESAVQETMYEELSNPDMKDYVYEMLLRCHGLQLNIASAYGTAYVEPAQGKALVPLFSPLNKDTTILILLMYQHYLRSMSEASGSKLIPVAASELYAEMTEVSGKSLSRSSFRERMFFLYDRNLVSFQDHGKQKFTLNDTVIIQPSIACLCREDVLEAVNQKIDALRNKEVEK